MHKKLLFGIIAIFFFAAVFTATLPLSVDELQDYNQPPVEVPSDDTEESEEQEPQDRIEEFEQRQQDRTDTRIYRMAVSNDDRTMCSEIDNITLRHDCAEATPAPTNTVDESNETEDDGPSYSDEDARTYREALSNGDSSLCEDIQNSDLREQCMNEVNA